MTLKTSTTATVTLIALGSLCLAAPATAEPPYPASQVVAGFELDWSTHDERAPGSDNWPITWADDDHQYTSWGDGGGFGGTNSDGRVSLGFARVEGPWDGYEGFNVWGGKDPENPAQFDGKSYGVLSVDGTFYKWWGPGSGVTSYSETRLCISTDRGATWTQSDWDLTETDEQLIMPTILNFGKDYAGARDGFVYHYFIRNEPTTGGLGIHKGADGTGKIDLARVPKEQLMEVEAYEFFAGLDAQGQPIWSSDAARRAPVFEDPNGVGWNVSVSHNAGLDRYLLATEHSDSLAGLMGLFDGHEPWGPWTTVRYYEDGVDWFGSDVGHQASTFFWNFANKWLSADGLDFSLVFTGTGGNDSWNTIRGAFTPGPCAAGLPIVAPSGSCPGTITLDLSCAAPDGTVALLLGTGPGSNVLPAGPCAGTEIGLDQPRLGPIVTVDASGQASLSREAGDPVCGRYVVALELGSCTAGDPAELP